MSKFILEVKDLSRVYKQAGESLPIVNHVDVTLKPGEIVSLVGPSGSGKSTFLQTVGLLDKQTSGDIFINGGQVKPSDENARTKLRRDHIGFVYQFHYLLPEFSALENIVIPQIIAGREREKAVKRAKRLLDLLKLSHRADHRPGRLSGGEQQRVAIGRALANKPKLLLADEPTGNLDPETSEIVFDLLVDVVRRAGIGAIIATHNMQIAERMDRILELKNGRILSY